MFTAKSTALYALVACLVLLCGAPCTLPAAAQGDAANPSRTFRFLQEFPKTIPQLRSLWTGTDYCSWSGVSCDDASAGTGVSITLGSRSYSGVTPDVPSGDGDVNVIQIDLAWNRGIRGRFRESWSALSQLTFLGLAGTSMYGDIPDAWNAMHALTFVDFRYTGACRSLPNWNFSSMPLLEYASFSETDLNLLSSSFGTFSASTRLQTFRLGGNRFCFCLPDTWTSALLRNTALDATRALGDPDCATKNSCTSSEVGACKDGFVSFVPSFTPLFTVVVGLLLFLC